MRRWLLWLLGGGACFMAGCATLTPALKSCAKSTTDETQAITDLFERFDITTAEAIAAAEGSKIALCVVSAIAHNTLDQAKPIPFASLVGSESPLLGRSSAWLAKHP